MPAVRLDPVVSLAEVRVRRPAALKRPRRTGYGLHPGSALIRVDDLFAEVDPVLLDRPLRQDRREQSHGVPGLILADRGNLHPGRRMRLAERLPGRDSPFIALVSDLREPAWPHELEG